MKTKQRRLSIDVVEESLLLPSSSRRLRASTSRVTTGEVISCSSRLEFDQNAQENKGKRAAESELFFFFLGLSFLPLLVFFFFLLFVFVFLSFSLAFKEKKKTMRIHEE